jgi:hypothetical protein
LDRCLDLISSVLPGLTIITILNIAAQVLSRDI